MAQKPYVVVVGTDFSKQSDRAVQTAYYQASRETPADLHVVHATVAVGGEATSSTASFTGLNGLPAPSLDELQAQVRTQLDRVLGPATPNNRVRVVAHIAIDEPSLGLAQLASRLEANLLVVGTHGRRGLARWMLGSVAEGVIRCATCQVLVVPPEQHELAVPAIEPACPRCIEARKTSAGEQLWCEQHRERHGRRHTYHQGDRAGADTNFPLVAH